MIGNLRMGVPQLYEDLTTMGVTVVIGLLCWAALRGLRPPSLATERPAAA